MTVPENIDPDITTRFGHDYRPLARTKSSFRRRIAKLSSLLSLPRNELPLNPTGIDVGSGSDSWSALVVPRVDHLLFDASASALARAQQNLTYATMSLFILQVPTTFRW
jgi:hypothetical protein